jgi:DNA polymerase-3 subunit alpha
MNSLIFDTETTGLPNRRLGRYYNPKNTAQYDSSRLVEIAWIVMDESGDDVKRKRYIIFPSDFTVKGTEFHGIDHVQAEKEGKNINMVLDDLLSDLKECDTIVAHNLEFDYNITLSECYRNKRQDVIDEMENKAQYCTMENGREYLGTCKYPKLVELYKNITGLDWNQKHNAMDDTEKCLECYRKMKN